MAASPRSVDRRTALAGLGLAGGWTAVPRAAAQIASAPPRPGGSPIRFAYVGCRTAGAGEARGDGLTVWRVARDGAWTQQQLLACENPSYLALNRAGSMLYAVHGDMTEISAFRVNRQTGALAAVNTVSTGGRNPVHLAFDRSGRFLVVANHTTRDSHVSNIAAIAVDADGSLGGVTDMLTLPGKIGPHRTEQAFSKPHQCLPDPGGVFMVVADKGLDRIFTLRIDDTGRLHRIGAEPAMSREGAGPRHAIFHPTLPYLFVLNELASTVTTCRFDPATGAIVPLQESPLLPDGVFGFNRSAAIDISPDGRFVYASNRGHDSIATLAFDQAACRLSPLAWTGVAGRTPRFFSLTPDGTALIVANQDSGTIVRFMRDGGNGTLAQSEVVARTGSPTCILFT